MKYRKIQNDLIKACWNKRVAPDYDNVREYAYNFKKYDTLSIRDIQEVVTRLKEFYEKS